MIIKTKMEHYCENHDVLNDLKRLKAKCELSDNQWDEFRRVVEESDIDRDYQRMLRFVLGKAEACGRPETERGDGVLVDDDRGHEIDPQYELFLGGLKEQDKVYGLERENNGAPLCIECAGESGSKDEFECARRVEKVDGPLNQLVVGGGLGVDRKEVALIDNEHLSLERGRRSDQARLVTKGKEQIRRKLKGKDVVEGDDEDAKPVVRIDGENFYRKPGPKKNRARGDYCKRVDRVKPSKKEDRVQGQGKIVKVGRGARLDRGDNGFSSQKPDFGKGAAKDRLDHNAKAQSSRKRARCNDEGETDVEILEDDAFRKNLSSFVPSKKVHASMGDAAANFQNVGSTSGCDGYRKEVLEILEKPFDQEELKRLREAVREGSYYHHYPDLERKLKRFRYKRGKCLNIIRGFFFWLQNVSRDGAFKPWNDRQCLAVEPGSPENTPPPHSTHK